MKALTVKERLKILSKGGRIQRSDWATLGRFIDANSLNFVDDENHYCTDIKTYHSIFDPSESWYEHECERPELKIIAEDVGKIARLGDGGLVLITGLSLTAKYGVYAAGENYTRQGRLYANETNKKDIVEVLGYPHEINDLASQPVEEVTETILDDGTIEYRNARGELHREGDKPAVIEFDGSALYFKNGVRYYPEK